MTLNMYKIDTDIKATFEGLLAEDTILHLLEEEPGSMRTLLLENPFVPKTTDKACEALMLEENDRDSLVAMATKLALEREKLMDSVEKINEEREALRQTNLVAMESVLKLENTVLLGEFGGFNAVMTRVHYLNYELMKRFVEDERQKREEGEIHITEKEKEIKELSARLTGLEHKFNQSKETLKKFLQDDIKAGGKIMEEKPEDADDQEREIKQHQPASKKGKALAAGIGSPSNISPITAKNGTHPMDSPGRDHSFTVNTQHTTTNVDGSKSQVNKSMMIKGDGDGRGQAGVRDPAMTTSSRFGPGKKTIPTPRSGVKPGGVGLSGTGKEHTMKKSMSTKQFDTAVSKRMSAVIPRAAEKKVNGGQVKDEISQITEHNVSQNSISIHEFVKLIDEKPGKKNASLMQTMPASSTSAKRGTGKHGMTSSPSTAKGITTKSSLHK
jgi:hypothetical protein